MVTKPANSAELNMITGAELLGTWLAGLEDGTPPVRFIMAAPFAFLDVRPGRFILMGGPPGTGKTAALLQVGVDLLRLNESARLLIANVEMSPTSLIERIVSRLSGVPYSTIIDRTFANDDLERVRMAVDGLRPIAGRMAFLGPPFAMDRVAMAADAFQANVMILDYLQRFTVGNGTKTKKEQIDASVSFIRDCCLRFNLAAICASSVARQKGVAGSNYQGLNMASMNGSSELEFGADDVYHLRADDDGPDVEFVCEKKRYGPTGEFRTMFDPSHQMFREAVELSGLDRFDRAKPAAGKKEAKGGKP